MTVHDGVALFTLRREWALGEIRGLLAL